MRACRARALPPSVSAATGALHFPHLALRSGGVDVAGSFSTSDINCFRENGVDFMIVRAWHSYGG